MMRYLILIAILMCLPVRGEAWQVVGGGASGGGTVTVLDDSFTSNEIVRLENHLPEIGGAWTTYAASPETNYLKVETDFCNPSSTTLVHAVSNSGSINVGSVTINGRTNSESSTRYYSANLYTSNSLATINDIDGYSATISGLGVLSLSKIVDGTSTTIAAGSTCTGYVATTIYDLILVAEANNYYSAKLLNGATEVCSVPSTQDNTYPGEKYPGLAAANISVRMYDIHAIAND